MKPRIYELCRKNKDTMNPRRTNEDLAGSANLELNTVAGFLRGEVANPASTPSVRSAASSACLWTTILTSRRQAAR